MLIINKEFWKNKKVAVLGAAFIGSHLVDKLVELGVKKIKIVNLTNRNQHYFTKYVGQNLVDFYEMDLRDLDHARLAVKDTDIVFHLAADHGGRGYVDTHQGATASNFLLDGSIFKACLEEKTKVVFASSGCVYPNYLQVDPSQKLHLRENMVKPPHDADNCFDDKTEVLTDNGWKFFKDLKREEKVLTLNSNTLTAEWQKPIRYVNNTYRGKMYSWHNKRIDLLVTPNHLFFIKSRYGKWKFKTLADMNESDDKVPMGMDWKGIDNIDIGEDSCAFLGIYLADGCVAGNMGGTSAVKNGNYDIIISKCFGIKGGEKGNVRIKCQKLLSNLGFHATSTPTGFIIRNKELWKKLLPLGNRYTKFIPKEYKELPPYKLKILIHWMLLGDGCIRKGHNVYYTTSKKLADDLQEIAIKAGFSASIRFKRNTSKWNSKNGGVYVVSFYTSKTMGFCGPKGSFISEKKYNGKIYCVEVKNHIIMVRRNGFCCWSGNSYGWAKLMAEETLKAYYKDYGLKSAILRYFTVYGPRGVENHAVIALIAKAFIKQDPYEIWGKNGSQIRNWTYIDDIVEGTILAAEKIDDATPINLGTIERTTVSEAVGLIFDYIRWLPEKIDFLKDMPVGPVNRVASNKLAKKLLNWEPKVKFKDGLKKTIDWYLKNKKVEEVSKDFKKKLMEII